MQVISQVHKVISHDHVHSIATASAVSRSLVHSLVVDSLVQGRTNASKDGYNLNDLEAIYYESAVILSWASSVRKS